MKLYNLLLIVFISILLPCMLYAGTAHYCDLSTPGKATNVSDTGAWGSPFESIRQVNEHAFAAGDDVYFLQGVTYNIHANDNRLFIDWGGTSGDQALIGCYSAEGVFTCSGTRPILDGIGSGDRSGDGVNDCSYPSGNEMAIIQANSVDYVTIQDIEIINSNGRGASINDTTYSTIENVKTNFTYRAGVAIYRTSNGKLLNNDTSDCYYYRWAGPCLEVGAMGGSATTNNTVRGNRVYGTGTSGGARQNECSEGIGIYKKVIGTIVEYNEIYDSGGSIYIDASRDTTIRYNLIYSTSFQDWTGKGIFIQNEAARRYCFTGGDKIYGNIVGGKEYGINIDNQCDDPQYYGADDCDGSGACNTRDVLVYNNTFVDNKYNIRIRADESDWSGNEITNNISWTLSAGSNHVSNYSPFGFTWSHNLFDDAVSGNAATNAVIGDPALLKTSGWRSLIGGNVDGSEFALTAASDAIDAGVSITGYNDRIKSADYTANPISVTTALDSIPDIGAWKYNNGDTTPPAKPTGLIVVE